MREGFNSRIQQSKGRVFQCTLVLLCWIVSLTGCRVAGTTGEVQIITRAESEGKLESSMAKPSVLESMETKSPERASYIVCEIKGQVFIPGIYDLAQGSRVADLIKRSGGILDNGSLEWVNQARKLSDGEVVVIPRLGTSRTDFDSMQLGLPIPVVTSGDQSHQTNTSSLVNINTASEGELISIPGIGPVTAQNIISHRTENGPFIVLEDLKKVNRIGDKTFEKLKPYISIGP